MDNVSPFVTMKAESDEMEHNNDSGGLELIQGCIKVKMEESYMGADSPEHVVIENIGENRGKIINEEDGVKLGNAIVDDKVDQ